MPTKNKTSGQLFCETNGEIMPLEIGELSLRDWPDIVLCEESITNNPEYFNGGEITLKISQKEFRKWKKIMRNICPIYLTNNWRKMHGLPIRRRSKK